MNPFSKPLKTGKSVVLSASFTLLSNNLGLVLAAKWLIACTSQAHIRMKGKIQKNTKNF